jgi:hypothetical protein
MTDTKNKFLPSFFQTSNSVLDELVDFELSGDLEEESEDNINSETFGDSGERTDVLPDFFKTKTSEDFSQFSILGNNDGDLNNYIILKNYHTST